MPRTRQYATDAERQAAYRARRIGDSQTPQAVASPGAKRWRGLAQQAERTLNLIQFEMQACHDRRSERWQEGEKAEEFLERLEALADIKDQIAEWATGD